MRVMTIEMRIEMRTGSFPDWMPSSIEIVREIPIQINTKIDMIIFLHNFVDYENPMFYHLI